LTSAPTFLRLSAIAAFLLAASILAQAQWMGRQSGCHEYAIVANPNRPTVASPADITQYGVLELEYGYDRLWPEDSVEKTSIGGLLKFGMLCDIELRWSTNTYLSETDATGTHRTFGDNWLGPQIRFYRQRKLVPTLSFSYAVKIPSASTEQGLGSGRADHAFTFLASKDIHAIHFDFNITEFLIDQSEGFNENQQLNLAFSRIIRGGLGFTGEFYGNTRLNQAIPGFASSLWALTYKIIPRLVIDGGYELGITSGGPHRHAFVGVTYSITNLYRK
jgi:hypothetical protein